jgi:hypothetical protein
MLAESPGLKQLLPERLELEQCFDAEPTGMIGLEFGSEQKEKANNYTCYRVSNKEHYTYFDACYLTEKKS